MAQPLLNEPSPVAGAPSEALLLGYAGLIPFFALALAPSTLVPNVDTHQAFVTYSAVILSFLGGIRWGGVCYRQHTVWERPLDRHRR